MENGCLGFWCQNVDYFRTTYLATIPLTLEPQNTSTNASQNSSTLTNDSKGSCKRCAGGGVGPLRAGVGAGLVDLVAASLLRRSRWILQQLPPWQTSVPVTETVKIADEHCMGKLWRERDDYE